MSFAVDAPGAAAVNAALAEWRQGDVASLRSISWIGSTSLPLTEASAEAAAEAGSDPAIVHVEVDAAVVVTQTCDIVRDCVQRPFVLVAPVVTLDGAPAEEALRGMRPRFVHVPGYGDHSFADLDHVTTLEKSVLVALDRTPGTRSDAEIRQFGLRVGRKHSRFAFPDDLAVSLRGLVARVRDKHDRASAEGRALNILEEIRAVGIPDWGADALEVFLIFAPPTREEADEALSADEWEDLVASWLRRTEPFGVVRSIDGAVIPLDELTAREYLDSDALDLDYLSS
jgi:hypothetical protein